MSYSLRLKGFFLGCVIGLALAARLAFAGLSTLFGSLGGVADYASVLSVLIAIIVASRLTERLSSYYARRTALRLLDEGFVAWARQLEARKSAASESSGLFLKKVA